MCKAVASFSNAYFDALLPIIIMFPPVFNNIPNAVIVLPLPITKSKNKYVKSLDKA